MNVKHVIWASIMSTTISCQSVKKEYTSFEEYPIPEGKLVEMEYSPIETKFTLWAPTAEEVRVLSSTVHRLLRVIKKCVYCYMIRATKVLLIKLCRLKWEKMVFGIPLLKKT